ncbi:hypothetical protein CB1_000854019 [Camelus ferus]|nr:hypothetical protein CB1_000854019 [Camelus ferus]
MSLIFIRSASAEGQCPCALDYHKFFTWSLLCCSDMAWNFEKFPVGPDSVPVHRYSHCFLTMDMELDIDALLSPGPSCA